MESFGGARQGGPGQVPNGAPVAGRRAGIPGVPPLPGGGQYPPQGQYPGGPGRPPGPPVPMGQGSPRPAGIPMGMLAQRPMMPQQMQGQQQQQTRPPQMQMPGQMQQQQQFRPPQQQMPGQPMQQQQYRPPQQPTPGQPMQQQQQLRPQMQQSMPGQQQQQFRSPQQPMPGQQPQQFRPPQQPVPGQQQQQFRPPQQLPGQPGPRPALPTMRAQSPQQRSAAIPMARGPASAPVTRPPPMQQQAGLSDTGARFGRRASPDGMSPQHRAPSPSSNRLAGLQNLKQQLTAGRTAGQLPAAAQSSGAYVPSAALMSPTRNLGGAQSSSQSSTLGRSAPLQQPHQLQAQRSISMPASNPQAGAPAPAANRSAALAALAARKAQQQPPTMQQQPPQGQYQQQQRPPPQAQSQPRQFPPPMKPQTLPRGGGGFGGNSIDDMPISPSKSFGSIPPEIMNAQAGPMVQCNSCGRSFNPQALQKHAKICAKVFCQKRKVFNSTAARVAGTEAAKFVDPRKPVKPQPAARGGDNRSAQGAAGKKAKWKAQSDQLRAAMKASRAIKNAQARGEDIRHMALHQDDPEDDDRVPCPHCGRKFASNTAERHIPHCKNTRAKPNMLRAGGGRGAHVRT